MKSITVLQAEREKAGLTKAALARKAEMQQGTIGQIESRRFNPYDSQLSKLASALDWKGDPKDLIKEVE